MSKTIRCVSVLAALFLCAVIPRGQKPSQGDFMTFGSWKSIPTADEKAFTYMGFINGYFAGDRSTPMFSKFANCIDQNISATQAVAMIDKYFNDNPQRWSASLSKGIVESLTVKDGPCPNLNPYITQ